LTHLERQKSYGPDKLCSEEAEEAEAVIFFAIVAIFSRSQHL
jgi:hypothetical protein